MDSSDSWAMNPGSKSLGEYSIENFTIWKIDNQKFPTISYSLRLYRAWLRCLHGKLSWESIFSATYHVGSPAKCILEFFMARNGPLRFTRNNRYDTQTNWYRDNTMRWPFARCDNSTRTSDNPTTVQSNYHTYWSNGTIHIYESNWIPDQCGHCCIL